MQRAGGLLIGVRARGDGRATHPINGQPGGGAAPCGLGGTSGTHWADFTPFIQCRCGAQRTRWRITVARDVTG